MRIVILSQNAALYSTSRLVEAAQARGHEVAVLNPLNCHILLNGSPYGVMVGEKHLRDIDAIIPRIGCTISYHGAVIVRQLESQGIFSTATARSVELARDNLLCLQVLHLEGIPVPVTAFGHHSYEAENFIESVGGVPVIIKLLDGSQGKGVILAEHKGPALSTIDALMHLKSRLLVQRFIQEAENTDIRVFIVDGKVIGAMRRVSKEGDFRSNLHQGGSALKVELTPREEEVALRSAEILGLKVAGIDLLQSNDGPLVLEANSSPGLEGIEAASGNDIAGAIIEYIERKAP